MFPANFLIAWLYQHVAERQPIIVAWTQHLDLESPKNFTPAQSSGSTIAVNVDAVNAHDDHVLMMNGKNKHGMFRLVVHGDAFKSQVRRVDALQQMFGNKPEGDDLSKIVSKVRRASVNSVAAMKHVRRASVAAMRSSITRHPQDGNEDMGKGNVLNDLGLNKEQMVSLKALQSATSLDSASSEDHAEDVFTAVDITDVRLTEDTVVVSDNPAKHFGSGRYIPQELLANNIQNFVDITNDNNTKVKTVNLGNNGELEGNAETPRHQYNMRPRLLSNVTEAHKGIPSTNKHVTQGNRSDDSETTEGDFYSLDSLYAIKSDNESSPTNEDIKSGEPKGKCIV